MNCANELVFPSYIDFGARMTLMYYKYQGDVFYFLVLYDWMIILTLETAPCKEPPNAKPALKRDLLDWLFSISPIVEAPVTIDVYPDLVSEVSGVMEIYFAI